MGVKVKFQTKDFENASLKLKKLKGKEFGTLVRQVINHTARKSFTQTSKTLREIRALKAGEVKSKSMGGKPVLAKGHDVWSMFAMIKVSEQKLGLRRFITNATNPENQKGIKVKSRRTLKAKIVKGRSRKLPHHFIQKGKGGSGNQVFIRKTSSSRPLIRPGVGSLAILLLHSTRHSRKKVQLQDFINRNLSDRFISQMNYKLEKLGYK
jgi:hypothetical protein